MTEEIEQRIAAFVRNRHREGIRADGDRRPDWGRIG
jgi:hypothetical protein